MSTLSHLLAALLCGLLVTGCSDARSDAITIHVHLEAALIAPLPEAPPQPASEAEGKVEVVGIQDPASSHHPRAPVVHQGGNTVGAEPRSVPCGSLGAGNLGGGKDAGLVLIAIVAVVLVAVVAWKIGTAVTAPHAAAPPATYALALGGGSEPALLLHLRDGHAIRLAPALVDALAHGGFRHATLQPTGSPVALPVLVELAGPMLCLRPVGIAPAP